MKKKSGTGKTGPHKRGSRQITRKPLRTRASQDAARQTIRRLKGELARALALIGELQETAETDFLLGIRNRRGFERDLARAIALDACTINALDPDLRPFFARGGKLIQYHGWNDPQISPSNSIDYYTSVLEKLGGAAAVSGSYRLFMVPGMGHCTGGDGTSTFDAVGALEQWREEKKAPERIPAARVRNGKVERTRPLCPYPQVAVYKGTGSTDDEKNFTCGNPSR